MTFQTEKALVRAHHAAQQGATPQDAGARLARHTAQNWLWRGMHPWNIQTGSAAVAASFWGPLTGALGHLQRREDIFFAGQNRMDGGASVWVASMGHLMGLFDAPWLGIRPTRKIAMLRYAEFHRVADGAIQETAQFVDLPHLMIQAGQNPFPPQTGAHLVQPGPLGHGGLLYGPQDPARGVATLAAIEAMISDLGTWQSVLPLEEELARTWDPAMIWWGPAGIGATYTIPRYAQQHSGPFRASFVKRTGTGHLARLAEGDFGGFFGWPNFTAIPKGGFLGMPASDTPGEFRVVDIYRAEGGKLVENWVFIDILHYLMTQGLDVLGRMAGIEPTARP